MASPAVNEVVMHFIARFRWNAVESGRVERGSWGEGDTKPVAAGMQIQMKLTPCPAVLAAFI